MYTKLDGPTECWLEIYDSFRHKEQTDIKIDLVQVQVCPR